MTRAARRATKPEVRITAGRWKGRVLQAPRGARPTASRAREALLSILQARIPGASVLDLYAGSGAVGLELLSRGAARVCLVETDAAALAANLARLAPDPGEAEILALPAREALALLVRRGDAFDVVFADPPYASADAAAILPAAAPLLAAAGLLVVQRDRIQSPFEAPEGLVGAGSRDYGRNVFDLFARADDGHERVENAPFP